LWASRDLGANWVLLAYNVTEFRYFWRVLNSSMEASSAVYYEKAINGEGNSACVCARACVCVCVCACVQAGPLVINSNLS